MGENTLYFFFSSIKNKDGKEVKKVKKEADGTEKNSDPENFSVLKKKIENYLTDIEDDLFKREVCLGWNFSQLNCVCYSPDKTKFVVSGYLPTAVRVYDIKEKKVICENPSVLVFL